MIAALAAGLGLAASGSRAAPDPGAFIGNLGQEGIQMMGPSVPPAQRAERFRQLFEADFAVGDLARFSIGRYWQAFSPAQQQDFMRLFQDYTVQAYADKLGQYGGSQFRVLGTQPYGDEIVVSTEVIRPNGPPVHIDWHVVGEDGQYKITDVDVDRVSMKVTQRDEFARIIQNNGGQPSALLAVLRQELRQDRATAAGETPTR